MEMGNGCRLCEVMAEFAIWDFGESGGEREIG